MSIADKLTRLDDVKSEIRTAITEKGQAIEDTDTFFSYADKIRQIESGGGGTVRAKDITFYDYDGTILYAYSISEFTTMTELPPPPSHDRLVFQEWNWSLADIKAMGRAVDVGATYTTVSGKSEFDLTLTAVTGLAVTIRIYNVTAGNIITVEWGDGTSNNAASSAGAKTLNHTYGTVGNYTVTVDSTGEYYPYGAATGAYNMFNKSPSHICTAARLGNRCIDIPNNAFYNCYSLQSITIPNSVTNIGVTKDANGTGQFGLASCYALQNIIIPDSVTIIGDRAFNKCYALKLLIMSNNITSIYDSTFADCYSLQSITIPNSVTNIGSNAFDKCYNMRKYNMQNTTPPSLNNISSLLNISQQCIIEVPRGSLQAYQTATNWATYAAYMREAGE